MKQGYTHICIHHFLDQILREVGENLGAKFPYSEMANYFKGRGEQFAFGEYWGKLVRGACYAYRYYPTEALKTALLQTGEEMLLVEKENGDLSPVAKERQPNGYHGSDVWERKYAVWGMLELYRTFLDKRFLDCAEREVLYLASQVGYAPKHPITETGWAFFGMESSSILDPVMQVYHLTQNPEVLDFARYIVESGCCGRANLFEDILAGVSPKDIGWNGKPEESIAKAYEMTSCMEGLLRYYQATGEEKWLRCVRTYLDKVIEEEMTDIGSGGADKPQNLGPGIGEQWNETVLNQANPDIRQMMETCVAVYFMKLCHALYLETEEIRYIEQAERTYFNALLAALSPARNYFDYFMSFQGIRGGVAGFAHEIGGMRVSCCSANGLTGIEMYPELCHAVKGDTVYLNLFLPMEMDIPTKSGRFQATLATDYPKQGNLILTVDADFAGELKLRIPTLARRPRLTKNGCPVSVCRGHYATLTSLAKGDVLRLTFDIPFLTKAVPGTTDKWVCTYGQIVLARDKRFDPHFDRPLQKSPHYEVIPEAEGELVRIAMGDAIFVDYASAGSTWDETSAFTAYHVFR